MNNIDPRIDQLFATITDLSHARNINKEAFKDISKALLSFHDKQNIEGVKEVCAASMGHGKSTVLTSYLKWITKQSPKQPILLALREKQLAHEIYNEVSKVSPNSIINIDSENKDLYQDDLFKYQIVIIQHQRLKNLCLGFGNAYDYSYYIRDKAQWGQSNAKEHIKRLLIIDEKPDFVDSVIFDITSENNVLEWFDHLAEPFIDRPRTLQKYKSYITFLLSEELADNPTDITNSLFKDDDNKSKRGKDLIKMLNDMKEHELNKNKYESLNKLNHFKKLLKENGYGRIDDYSFGAAGRKIIISKYVDYFKLGLNVFIFDGTLQANFLQYLKGKYKGIIVKNRNDYTRLTIQNDRINTSKYSRSKKGHTTQKAIAGRIKELKNTHKDLFVLPMKEEIPIYIKENIISESDKHLYYDDVDSQTKGINLLNTIGKNTLKNKTSLYLTSLPKRNADYYKQIAIAIYGNDLTLLTSDDSDNSNWFQDDKLERIYKGELYAEILQIIHRTTLRNINGKDQVNIYMAFDDEPKGMNMVTSHDPIIDNVNRFLNDQANTPQCHIVYDMSLYGRDRTLENFAKQAYLKLRSKEKTEIPANSVSNSFKKYLHNHWESKSLIIKEVFKEFKMDIYINENDKRKPKRIKLI